MDMLELIYIVGYAVSVIIHLQVLRRRKDIYLADLLLIIAVGILSWIGPIIACLLKIYHIYSGQIIFKRYDTNKCVIEKIDKSTYVSIGTAQNLYTIGYRGPCQTIYKKFDPEDEKYILIRLRASTKTKCDPIESLSEDSNYLAPTVKAAKEWIWDERNLQILIRRDNDRYTYKIKGGIIDYADALDDIDYDRMYFSYEKAFDAAVSAIVKAYGANFKKP